MPAAVMEASARAAVDFNGMGLSILEISHRSKEFEAVMAEAESLVRELSGAGDEYAVLFLGGGASTQFFMAPMNLLNDEDTACYVDSGVWATKAIKEAKNFGKIEVIASSKDSNYNYVPKDYTVAPQARYLHLTSNNTIYGTEIHEWLEADVPIVSDMSSDMFSRPIDIERFGLIYAGAQKNLGPAGVTLVIVRKDLLGHTTRKLPAMLDYRIHADNGSMYNTPPVFPIYTMMLTLRWIKEQGGLEAIALRNVQKAQLLYNEIDANPLFTGTAAEEDRSLMNVCFVPVNPEHEAPFMEACKAAGISGVKGHRSVGGFRASIYNAMPQESVQVLVDVMRDFAKGR